MKEVMIKPVMVMGMPLLELKYKSCVAHIATGTETIKGIGGIGGEIKWASVYDCASKEEGKGHATHLLKEAKKLFEGEGYRFGCTVSLNPTMSHILSKLKIHEYR